MIAPGQVTDDSELMLCLMQGIVEGNEQKKEAPKKKRIKLFKNKKNDQKKHKKMKIGIRLG